MNIINIFFNFFSEYHVAYVLPAVIKLTAALIACVFLWIKKPRWRNAGYAVILVLLVRLVLFENPYSWGYYFKTLGANDVGWRQQTTLGGEYYKFFKIAKPKKYLCVGSSQTYGIYTPYSKEHNHLIVFNLSGMGPMDMYLYRQYVIDRRSEYILLFLSDFDIAKEPNLDGAKISPSQGFGLIRELPVLYKIAHLASAGISVHEMIVGEFFPEYKYSYILRGFLDKWTGKRAALAIKSIEDDVSFKTDEIRQNPNSAVNYLDEKWIPYNVYFLKKFLAFCKAKGQKVIMVEGQYNPLVETDKNLGLQKLSRKELEDIDRTFDNVTFIPREKTIRFSIEEYKDSVHVTSEAGTRFAEDLIRTLESSGGL